MQRLSQNKTYKCVGVYIFNENDELLLLNHYKRGYCPPGGFTENTDFNMFYAACREFKEETLSEMPFENEIDFATCAFGPSCLLFVCKKKITLNESNNIIKNFDKVKIDNKEILDISFVSLKKLFTKQVVVGMQHQTRAYTAGFLPRALRRLKYSKMLKHIHTRN